MFIITEVYKTYVLKLKLIVYLQILIFEIRLRFIVLSKI